MNRLELTFKQLQEKQEKALITYITAGDPNLDFSLKMMHNLADNGVDVLEIGFPFSEPMADGPVIQRAIERSLKSGTTLREVLSMVREFRNSNQHTPIVLMGYLNPVLSIGYAQFSEEASKAGVDGVLIVDCPVESIQELNQNLKNNGIESIFLVTPTTSQERVKMIAKRAGGFLYYVSLKGVTGSSELNVYEVRARINIIRSEITIPIVVGFGIKLPKEVREISTVADGVVVGSRVIEEIEKDGIESLANVASLVQDFKLATRVK